MIARQLETLIDREIRKISMSPNARDDMPARFENLRAYNLLPKGKIRNSQHLTMEEICCGVLAVIAPKVGFSGHTALILKSLKPVGGIGASYHDAETLSQALETILDHKRNAFEDLIKISISDSEIYTNSSGRAEIHYRKDDKILIAYFICGQASSLLQSGAESNYNPADIISSVTNEMTFYPSFFRPIRESLKYESRMPEVEYPKEQETDEEIEKQKRAEYLGLGFDSNFLNLGVDCQITWPRQETLVNFDGYKLVLMPKTKEYTTSIHIDLVKNKVSHEEAKTIINRFLSLLSWCDDQYAVLQGGWSGNPVPVAVARRDLAFSTADYWAFNRKSPEDLDTQRAIAIYREGRNAEQNFLISYAVLSYYKILEIRYKGQSETRTWFKNTYAKIKDTIDQDTIALFDVHRGAKPAENYLWDFCRSAVAHANKPTSTNPDDSKELTRLHTAADILRRLSRHFIKEELKVSEHYFDGS